MVISSNQELNIIYIVPSFLSLIGSSSIIIILLFGVQPSIRKNHRLLFWLSVSDLIRSISSIFDGFSSFFYGPQPALHPDPKWCYPQGIAAQTSLIPLLWVACIVIKFLMEVRDIELKHEMLFFHLFCWGSFIVQIIVLSVKKQWGTVGDGGYCWIKGNTNPYRLFLYIPVVFVIIFCFIAMSFIYYKLRYNVAMTRQSKTLILNLFAYPIILVFCWLAWVINRIQNAVDPLLPNRGLYIWGFVTNSLQGALNALVFFWYPFQILQKKKYGTRLFTHL